MALRDKIDKIISYFDTDEVSDVEETESTADVKNNSHVSQARTNLERVVAASQPQVNQGQTRASVRSRVQQPSSSQVVESKMSRTRQPEAQPQRRVAETSQKIHTIKPKRDNQTIETRNEPTTTIALKYPRKYEDAQYIVDLLILNECVLIDFQYMLDAQARRCLDFIDGASRVLYGSLQKVGSSMYLLTPSNIVVDIEELNIPNNSQDLGFDFDMKRR